MSADYPFLRRLGAFPGRHGRTEFRVWAPDPTEVLLRAAGADHALDLVGHGIYEAVLDVPAGTDYEYVIDGEPLPDPCSRWQPQGLRGPSRVLDPEAFEWTDNAFRTPGLHDAVIYELHVGTFSPEGTFAGAIPYLQGLAELGVTVLELMPVAEFPGARGWSYDGVYLSAAQSSYGGPEQLQKLIDAAHAAGLAVILDVVYNHIGASGNKAVLAYGPYFTHKHETPWGASLNVDGEHSDAVREWVCQSAEQWIRDFHFDGLRLDAIHAIVDSSPEHLVAEVTRRVHAINPGALVIAESGMNDPKVMRVPELGGYGCDAAWADDFHHALRVLLTGETQGWYEEFDSMELLAKAFRRPHVHDGNYSTFRKRRFGAPAFDVGPEHFVVFSADHDQVGNRAFGDRLPVETRPLAAFCTLLSPFTPMLFQGEEYGERAPFQFFTDHIDPEIADATREGRRREFASFAAFAGEEVPDPQDPETFQRSKLTREGEPAGLLELHRELLRVRRELPAGDVEDVTFDERAGWLAVKRGDYTLLANFARATVHVPREQTEELVLATHEPTLEPGFVVLPPLSGALVR
ncbi:malto-oligosyltrehalose trehalohydrolase [Solirubrobacter sp. CPCC 204708]|uniref:Malto-oligosyltrehalose trehalohydrolase n=1 Tax=Solirubrobacter deserti TaxID=2282478 RepID=A0ABT4RRU4_9ACTN|nr:malto-oligosyltrehalose trehalohydrolase [Solirubrobacter deserti]MBE2317585.1 malto-oligosyltrehalose trehalohydrolase [Solirubrobacter deserti]MDA0141279.1 malto-oligosyltrehalose trehalohydrolase [Solirubrobacter deserti]